MAKGKDAFLITHGNDYAIAHRLDDGSEIWPVGGLNPKDNYNAHLRFVASPVATPDLIVIPSAKDHGVVGLRPDAQGVDDAGNEARRGACPAARRMSLRRWFTRVCLSVCEDGCFVCLTRGRGPALQSAAARRALSGFAGAADGRVYLTAATVW